MIRWGIDLGGTKIEGAIIDEAIPGKALYRIRIPTERHHGYEHILAQIEHLLIQLEALSGMKRPAHLGIGTPGTTDPATGKIKNSNTTCLNDRCLRADLSHLLQTECILANDANCFTLAEATWGAAKGYNVVMGLILGTGVGGGLVIHGHLLEGLHGIAGEWGHNRLPGELAACYCGQHGCNEQVFSGPALESFYEKETGSKIPLSEIERRYTLGEPTAIKTLERLQNKFAEAISIPINILDPDAIVIGGGVGNINLLYADSTRARIAHYLFNKECKTAFLRPSLGDSAGVFGAAIL